MTHLNEPLIKMIKRHEGFSSYPYRCSAGYTTVGYGHNLDVAMVNDEATALLEVRLRKTVRGVVETLPSLSDYGDARANALIDLAFNVGIRGFRMFRRMINAIHAGDWDAAADEMKDSNWYSQVGGRGRELVHMVRTGGCT